MTDAKGWVPVALSASIEPGTSAGAVVDGAEIVVWRDDKGEPHVWEDRCPHRGMRMSFGFVRGDHIACLYHGWSYDTGGQCRYIPAHPDLDVPKTIKIATYETRERSGVIWTALGPDADIAGIPDFGPAVLPVRSLYADCSLDRALAVLRETSLPVAQGAPEPASLEKMTTTCWSLTAGSTRLMIAVQTIGPSKIALHILLDDAEGKAAAMRPAIARWAESLRNTLESSVTGAALQEVA
jgi:nitrite reductase/ring-hydroxylating ferredoxin subunit